VGSIFTNSTGFNVVTENLIDRLAVSVNKLRFYSEGNAYRLLVGKPKGKRPLGRPRRRWVDNIRMDLGEVG
jgi:hypothetical protein